MLDADRSSRRWFPASGTIALAGFFALLAIAYPVWRGFLEPVRDTDFRYFWAAGYTWSAGFDPYSSDYARIGSANVPEGVHIPLWCYPPNWWLFSQSLAVFAYDDALLLFKGVATFVFLSTTAVFSWRFSHSLAAPERWLFVGIACAFTTIIEPTGHILTSGQVSPVLLFLGIFLIATGVHERNDFTLIIGLVLVALKPQQGFFVYLMMLCAREYRVSVLVACVVGVALTMPHFIDHSPITTFHELRSNLHAYGEIKSNNPFTMTGPSHLLARAGISSSFAIQYLAATGVAIGAGLLLRKGADVGSLLALVLASIGALVPLHVYDHTFLVLVAIMLIDWQRGWKRNALIILPLSLLLRPGRVERAFGLRDYFELSSGILLTTVAALSLFALAIFQIISVRVTKDRLPHTQIAKLS